MTYKARQAASMFNKLGINRSSSTHHIKGFLENEAGEKLFPPIYYNKGSKDIPTKISEKMRRGLLLDKKNFDRLITCKLSREGYLEIRDDN